MQNLEMVITQTVTSASEIHLKQHLKNQMFGGCNQITIEHFTALFSMIRLLNSTYEKTTQAPPGGEGGPLGSLAFLIP